MEKKVIGIYALANAATYIWFGRKNIYLQRNNLENMDFEIVENLKKNKTYQGYRTVSAKERAEEIMNLVKNKDIDIMMPCDRRFNSEVYYHI